MHRYVAISCNAVFINISYIYASAAFLDALVHHIDVSRTHFGKRCTSISPSSSHPTKMTISFADGSTSEADVVLGADGIKSSVRNYVLDTEDPGTEKKEGFRNAIFSNTICYRGLVPMERLKGLLKIEPTFKRPVCWVGSNKVRFCSDFP